MAREEKVEAPKASLGLPEVRYARFYQPVQFVGMLAGVHNDTSKLSRVRLEYDMIGLRITYEGRTVVVGWPNIVYVELS